MPLFAEILLEEEKALPAECGGTCNFTEPVLVWDYDWKDTIDRYNRFTAFKAVIQFCNEALVNYDIYCTRDGIHVVCLCESYEDVQLLLDLMHDYYLFEKCQFTNDYRNLRIRITPKFDKKTGKILSDMPHLQICHCENGIHVDHRLKGQFVIYPTTV